MEPSIKQIFAITAITLIVITLVIYKLEDLEIFVETLLH
jgi:hypothetical protein